MKVANCIIYCRTGAYGIPGYMGVDKAGEYGIEILPPKMSGGNRETSFVLPEFTTNILKKKIPSVKTPLFLHPSLK